MASFQNRIRVWEETKNQSMKYFANPKPSIKLNSKTLPEPNLNRQYNTQVYVWNMDTLDAVWHSVDQLGARFPVVLNMADMNFPGGCVDIGSAAQEENLFRRSNYFLTLNVNSGFYPISDESCIYSPEVVVFREGETTTNPEDFTKTTNDLFHLRSENPDNSNFRVNDESFYKLMQQPRTVSIIASASVANPQLTPDGKFNENDFNLERKKIEMIFRTAAHYGHDTVVLSAYGCGAFRCPIEEVAKLFRNWTEHYNGVFKYIIFAIRGYEGIESNNISKTNIQVFSEVFSTPLKPIRIETIENNLEQVEEIKPKRVRKRIRYKLKNTNQ